jgi:hypothetical protein
MASAARPKQRGYWTYRAAHPSLGERLAQDGDEALVHGLRGRPSNRRLDEERRAEILRAYRTCYADFGPTFASEKLAAQGLPVSAETLRQWLLREGLWQRQRRRDIHRSRRPRRRCFGELIQLDTLLHDLLERRGEEMVLVAMIDDATVGSRLGFYQGETVEAYMDLTERWLRRHGRPLALYTDKDSVFQWHSQGRATQGLTQFGRALQELDMELILAHSPQAKGRIERLFGTAQDRWVKELRLAKVDPSGSERPSASPVGSGIQPAFCGAGSRRRRRSSCPGTALLLAGHPQRTDETGGDE